MFTQVLYKVRIFSSNYLLEKKHDSQRQVFADQISVDIHSDSFRFK